MSDDIDCSNCDLACGDCDCDCDCSRCCDNCYSSGDNNTVILCINFGYFRNNQVNGCWWCCDDNHRNIPRQRTTQSNWAGDKRNKEDKASKPPKNNKCAQCPYPDCQECSSGNPTFDPPISQRFETLDREKYVGDGKNVFPYVNK